MTDVILHITAGKGPDECRWVVARLGEAFCREAVESGLAGELVEAAGDLPSMLLLRVTGDGAEGFAQIRCGSILWTGASPFRPNHKRKNWFVGVALAPEPEGIADLRDTDIDYQAMRASGPGGQHVNKTDSAVRAIHRPTGLTAISQEQRSQHANRRIARLKLAMLIEEKRIDSQDQARRSGWELHQQLERGNPVRIYAGPRFLLKR